MADGADPSVRRRRLAVELRRGRNVAQLTQREVIEQLDWSMSKLIRIESGAQGISVTDVKALLDLYGITDADRVNALTTTARGSRGQSSWTRFRDIVSPQFAMYLGHESEAESIRVVHPFLVPGLLHTEEYAAALMSDYRDQGRTARIVELRMERQERLFASGEVSSTFVFGEEALQRWIGGPQVVSRQLERLVDIGQRPNVSIRIVPFTAGSHPGLQGPFNLLHLKGTDEEVLFRESISGDQLTRDEPDQISEYIEYFVKLADDLALPPERGEALLREHIDRLRHAKEA